MEKELPSTKTEWADIMHNIYMNKSSVFPAKKPYRKIIGQEFISKQSGSRIKIFASHEPATKNPYYYIQSGCEHYLSYYFLRKYYDPI